MRRLTAIAFLTCIISLLFSSCGDEQNTALEDPYDIEKHYYAGGEGTIFLQSSQSYAQPIGALTKAEYDSHMYGDRLFEATFVQAGNPSRAGLGPLYNNTSCFACHPRDGRSPFPANLTIASGFFLRVSSGNDPVTGPVATPGFGKQLQHLAIPGFVPETKFAVRYEDKVETYADGTSVVLKKPFYSVYDTYIPMPSDAMFSPRIGMAVFGLGLLEAIPESAILAYADPDDRDGDEISGKANYVQDALTGKTVLGRFGWKANTATLYDQCAAAFVNDMGLTTPLFPMEPTMNQSNGNDGLDDDPELNGAELDAVVLYCRTLGVPAPRRLEAEEVKQGARLFEQVGCTKCHVPSMKTGKTDIQALSDQTIYAYTDMLLHDMGEDMADNRPDFLADGNEWKTRPLWGIGLVETVHGYTYYLHDGRAKTLEEAILWHAGEADNVKNEFKKLSKTERNLILAFLEAL